MPISKCDNRILIVTALVVYLLNIVMPIKTHANNIHPNDLIECEFESNYNLKRAFYGGDCTLCAPITKSYLDTLRANAWNWTIKYAAKRFSISHLPIEVSILLEIEKRQLQQTNSNEKCDFLFLMPYHEAVHATDIHVYIKGTNKELQVTLVNLDGDNSNSRNCMPMIYLIKCNHDDLCMKKLELQIKYYLGRPFTPANKELLLDEKQFVIMKTSTFILSAYIIESQKTYFVFNYKTNVNVISLHHFANLVKITNGVWGSGPYLKIAPLSFGEAFVIRFMYPRALEFAPKCNKRVNVSNIFFCQNVNVSEEYTIINEAAPLKGNYNSENVKQLFNRKSGSIRHLLFLEATFPKDAININVKDELGMIHSVYSVDSLGPVDSISENQNIKSFEIIPRYPLLGGWKMSVQVLHSFPKYISILNILRGSIDVTIDPAMDLYIQKYTITIHLPYGVSDIKVTTPPGIQYNTINKKSTIWGINTIETAIVLSFNNFHTFLFHDEYGNSRGLAYQLGVENTVEGWLFKALKNANIANNVLNNKYSRAARTDKDVHALHNYCSFYVDACPPASSQDAENKSSKSHWCFRITEIAKVINKHLPNTIRINSASLVEDSFDSRLSCIYRIYKYYFQIENMDLSKMVAASQYFIGTHDYTRFSKVNKRNPKNPTRTIFSFEIIPHDSILHVATIKARSFLWHQVRCMMGALFLVGNGTIPVTRIKDMLDEPMEPKLKYVYNFHHLQYSYKMANPNGLILYDCGYEMEFDRHYTRDAALKVRLH
ncbi:bifunctional Pseudouridine synthase I [Babesia duncani]|uniref:Bifunctional Pseudouridine synthase I n=1 Tax=Babesia duncani TaxID=323732 RepID=A0AAD9PN71_9APIC|nr:bifunctional Pseudouridine synthase I [Babesia duncani]KAK2194701.1 bifunctional Pseudouridine synthase I [Babesia duncani]KAK2197984.1 bifunctional Pseudouridine synthase I [Babesia duncani]